MARNLYWREGGWWFGQQVKGKRTWINLQAIDEAKAICRVRQVRADPIMRPAVGLLPEVDAFIAYRRSKGLYSKNSADTKVLILKAFARWLPATSTLANVTPAQCDAFYHAVQTPGFDTENRRKLKKPAKPAGEVTVHSYMMTLRAFFRWTVEVRRARFNNPVERLELPRLEHKNREHFCEKATKNALLAAATNDDLRFILFCGFDAGLRRDKISEARRDWFDLERGSLQVRNADKERLRHTTGTTAGVTNTYYNSASHVRWDNGKADWVQPGRMVTTPTPTPVPSLVPTPTPTPTPVAASYVQVSAATDGAPAFVITRTGDVSHKIVVHYAVSGSAQAGKDYLPLPGKKKTKPAKLPLRSR